MNTLVIKRGLSQIATNLSFSKLLALGILLVLLSTEGKIGTAVATSLSDAYLQVSVFVAGTLGALFLLEQLGRDSMERFLKNNRKLHVGYAALLGVLPGCGGAIVVITQYVRGAIGYGGMVAVLTATMGDAAFLLLAREPLTAMLVFAVCLVAGLATGYLVEYIHGDKFMRAPKFCELEEDLIEENPLLTPLYKLWMLLFVPGAVLGLAIAFQQDPAAAAREWLSIDVVTIYAVSAAVISVAMWAFNPLSDIRLYTSSCRPFVRRVTDTTNFVTFWVILAYVSYELLALAGVSVSSFFSSWAPTLPLIGLLVGFIPGCGPQIVVTTLYLAGSLPLSALMANAISNDGDALFPAIAVAPKAAMLATAYTAVPALIVGYTVYFFFE